MNILSYSPKQTREIAAGLAPQLKSGDVLALAGNLGSGKTAFVKGLAAGLGCPKNKVLSPTFVLMRQYKGRLTLNHFDLYRLKNIHQLEQIGYEEYFYSDGITAIEWADKIEECLPEEYLRVDFKILDENKRRLNFSSYPKNKFAKAIKTVKKTYADNLRKT